MKLMNCVKLASLVILTVQLRALAVDSTWTNTAGGDWSDPTRWNNGVPGPTTNAFLTNSATTSYVATNDVLNNTISNLTVFNASTGTNTLLMDATGFHVEGNAIIGNRGVLNLNGFDATIDGTMVISNLGRAVITNGGFLQVGSTANGLLVNTGNVFISTGGTIAAGVVSNGGFITTYGGAVISGSVVNVQSTAGAFGLHGINLSGTEGDGSLSLIGPEPFLNNVNNGTIFLVSNATLNVGGTNAATATGSFTNRGTIASGFPNSGSTIAITINAGTIVNDTGAFLNIVNRDAASVSNIVNADVINHGTFAFNDTGADIHLVRSMPTNTGTFITGNNAASQLIFLSNSVYNAGRIDASSGSDETFVIRNGAYINGVNSTSLFNRTTVRALGFLQEGFLSIVMSGVSISFLETNGVTGLVFTNSGTLRWEPGALGGNTAIMTLGRLENTGDFLILGRTNTFNGIPTVQASFMNIAAGLSNQITGTVNLQSNAIASFDAGFVNQGTISLTSNSVLSVGRVAGHIGANSASAPTSFLFQGGQNSWTNEGTVNLVEGSYLAARSLSNATTGILSGAGHVGPILFRTITNISGTVTQFVQNATVADIGNAGAIVPNGILNVGAITNHAGGTIIGSGVIRSINVTNFFDGLTLVNSNYNTGARIHNAAGGTILASGGLLVLSNGFVNNTQFGTFGATNGGTIQLGDGTVALTNKGTISIFESAIHVGDLKNEGIIEITDSVVTWSNLVVNAGRYISDPSTNIFLSDVTVDPAGTLEGGVGDVFDFRANLIINSTNTSLFDLASSTVSFSGGVDHTNAVTGLDFGKFLVGLTPSNFAYGTLDLSSLDNLHLIDGDDDSNTNALYVNILDLGGTTNNVSLLHSAFNIYYNPEVLANSYLNEQTFVLTGGGSLIPLIPEPSAAILTILAVAAIAGCRKQGRSSTCA